MGFWTGVGLGIGLMLIAVALTFGFGMLLWRMWWDSELGHAWIEDWRETVNRWRRK